MCVCKRLIGANKGGEKMRSKRCMGVKVWNGKFPLKGRLTLSDTRGNMMLVWMVILYLWN